MVNDGCLEGRVTDGGQHVLFQIKNYKLEMKTKNLKRGFGNLKVSAMLWFTSRFNSKIKSLSILICIFLGLKYNCSIIEMKSGRCFSWWYCEGFLAISVASKRHLLPESLSCKDLWAIPTNSVWQGRANPAAVYFHQTSWSVLQILQIWWNPKYSLSNTFLL